MIYGYARVSTDGQSVTAQAVALANAGADKVFRETASGANPERKQLRKALDALQEGDVLLITRLDRLARSTRDLLNTLATIAEKKAGFRSLSDAWADTTTPHGEADAYRPWRAGRVRARANPCPHQRRPGTRQSARRASWPQAHPHASPAARGACPPRQWRSPYRNRPQL